MTRAGGNDTKAGKSGGREKRLAAALRENLRRRKAQARGRGTQSPSVARAKSPPRDGETR
jgi:hypothetical protein